MKCAVSWILVLAVACGEASAQAMEKVSLSQAEINRPASEGVDISPWSGMLAGSSTQRWGSGRFNPENVVRMPGTVHELATVLDYQTEGLSARLRMRAVERDIAHGTGDPLTHDVQIDLTQLNWTHLMAVHWSMSIGRMNLGFDDGQSYHPLDFFEDTVRGTDFEDRAGRNRGFPLVMLQRITQEGGLRLIYSDDGVTDTAYAYGDPNPNFNRGLRQAVLSWRRSQGAWTWTTLLQRPWPGYTGVGGSFSWVPASAWSLYGSAFGAPGNPLPVHRNVAADWGSGLNGSDVYTSTSPMGHWQADDGRWRLRWLLGTQYTWEEGDSMQFELWRDGRGMNADELRTWHRVLAFHDGLTHPVARRVNLGYDQEAMRTPSGVHLFSRYSKPLSNGGTLQISLLLAQDRSGTLGLRWQGPRWSLGDLSLESWRRFGADNSRYGVVPDRQGLSLDWRILF